jgi:hypothetical protein
MKSASHHLVILSKQLEILDVHLLQQAVYINLLDVGKDLLV